MNRLLLWGTTAIGLLCLVYSVRSVWFALPVSLNNEADVVTAQTIQPWVTHWFQAGALAVSVVISGFWLFRPGRRFTDISLLSLWFVLLLTYPCFVIVHDSEISGRAAWLQAQHENLTWLGGDLSVSEEYKNANWKSRLYIVDTPRRVSLLQLPTWQPTQFGLDRLPDLLDWLGLTNTFCQFVQTGWLVAMFGTACLLLASCFSDGVMQLSRLRHAGLAVFLATTFICPVAWSCPFRAGSHITEARELTARGQYSAALEHIERAAQIMPVLREDTDYIAQVGLLEHRLQRPTDTASLFVANLLEREGFTERALEQYELLALDSERPSALRREACRGMLRSAVNTLNSGSISDGMDQLRRVLTVEPCSLKANYVLQLACLHSGRRQELSPLVDRIYAIYACFRFPNKKVVLAASHQNEFFTAVQADDLGQAMESSVLMKHP